MKKAVILRLIYASLVAALYVVITLLTMPISFGMVQFRISEVLNILPLFFPESILGLTIGCLISNLFSSGNVLLDCTLGTLATLLASVSCYFIGRIIKKEPFRIVLGIIPAIVINAVIVPFTFLALTELKELYILNSIFVGLGQLGVLTIFGIPLYYSLKSLNEKYNFFK